AQQHAGIAHLHLAATAEFEWFAPFQPALLQRHPRPPAGIRFALLFQLHAIQVQIQRLDGVLATARLEPAQATVGLQVAGKPRRTQRRTYVATPQADPPNDHAAAASQPQVATGQDAATEQVRAPARTVAVVVAP